MRDQEGMISVGTHSLYINLSGPSAHSAHSKPLVLVVAGMGDSHLSWKAFQRLASQYYRVCLYERSGIGRSQPSAGGPRTAEAMAKELQDLLAAADLPGPYVVVTHSYGAIIAREFLALDHAQIAGMVFVDAEQEQSYKRLQVPWESVHAVLGDLDYYETTGLDTEHALTAEEWQSIKNEDGNQAATDAEQAESDASCEALANKQQYKLHPLEGKPVVVIKAKSLREYTRIFDTGTRVGNGTPEQRADMEALMERMRVLEDPLQREQMMLSPSNSRFVQVEDGHNVHVTNPKVIVDEVEWVMARV